MPWPGPKGQGLRAKAKLVQARALRVGFGPNRPCGARSHGMEPWHGPPLDVRGLDKMLSAPTCSCPARLRYSPLPIYTVRRAIRWNHQAIYIYMYICIVICA
uniref:Uncharacterized protein n=1 Tax=Haptolina brevifila TaxID=156173 RepID=A0A7S2CLU1_9EUKA